MENERKGTPISISNKTGKQLTKQDLQDRINELTALNKKNTPRMKRWHFWSTTFFVICHVFLFAGFILLVCSKLPDGEVVKLLNCG
jgi:cell division septal protein FtsQ